MIRQALRRDIPACVQLWKALMDLTARYNDRYRLRTGATELQREIFADYLRRDDSYLLVGEVDHRLLAFSNGYLTLPGKAFGQTSIGVLENLYVVETWRRQGGGRQMAEAAIEWLTREGALEIYVNVIPKNTNSLQFWRHMGFEVQRLAMTRQV